MGNHNTKIETNFLNITNLLNISNIANIIRTKVGTNGHKFAVVATGIVRILKTFNICFFFGKIEGFSTKKTRIFYKIDKGCKLAVECVSNVILPIKCHFRPNYEFFWQENLKYGKVRKYNVESAFFRKKNRFKLLIAFLTKKGRRKICWWKPVILYKNTFKYYFP